MDYQPSTSTYRDYMTSHGEDPPRYRDYISRQSEYQPNNEPYSYKPYGETDRQRSVRDTPKPRPLVKQYSKSNKDMKLFNCYRLPTGPDYRVDGYNMGPEYRVSPYRPVSVKHYTIPDQKYVDPLKQPTGYKDATAGYYNSYSDYKLTKENNPGMRHWKYDFVDDTVYGGRGENSPKQKYKPSDERNRSPVERKRSPEPKTSRQKSPEPKRYTERRQSPQYIQPLPVVAPIADPPPAKKKTFKSQPTQTEQTKKTKSSSVQTKPQKNVQMAAPLVTSMDNRSNRPWSRQTSPNREQYQRRSPITEPGRRSPIRSEPVNNSPVRSEAVQSSPVKTTPMGSPNDMYYEPRRASSSEIVPLVYAGNPGGQRNTPPSYGAQGRYTPPKHERDIPTTNKYENPVVQDNSQYRPAPQRYYPTEYNPTPYEDLPHYEKQDNSRDRSTPQMYYPTAYNPTPYEDLPHYENRQDVQAAGKDIRERPNKSIPNEHVRSRLPPEVTACIEAYNGAHVGGSGSLSSMRRSMGLS